MTGLHMGHGFESINFERQKYNFLLTRPFESVGETLIGYSRYLIMPFIVLLTGAIVLRR